MIGLPTEARESTIALICDKCSCIDFSASLVDWSWVLSWHAVGRVYLWKYSWICSRTSYEWADPRTWERIDVESVDCNHVRSTWSCCSNDFILMILNASFMIFFREKSWPTLRIDDESLKTMRLNNWLNLLTPEKKGWNIKFMCDHVGKGRRREDHILLFRHWWSYQALDTIIEF